MSSQVNKKIDQKEYLKKYLSGDKKKKKKKEKKRKKEVTAKVKIIDESTEFNAQADIDEDLLLGGEDAPQIVGEYIEERVNGTSAPKWRSLTVKKEEPDSENEQTVKRDKEADLWGRKASEVRIKDEFSPPRKTKPSKRENTPDSSLQRKSSQGRHRSRSSDLSPVRRRSGYSSASLQQTQRLKANKKRGNSISSNDQSPPRKNKRPSSDNSPPRKSRDTQEVNKNRVPSRSISPGHSGKNGSSSQRKRSQSPKLQLRKRDSSADQSPIRRRDAERNNKRGASPASSHNMKDTDLSPPRRGRRITPDRSKRQQCQNSPDLSPPRRKRQNSTDHSPPQRQYRNLTEQSVRQHRRKSPDNSPPRRKLQNSSDHTPPRRQRQTSTDKSTRQKRHNSSDLSPPRRRRQKSSDHSPAQQRRQNSSNQQPVRRYSPLKRSKQSISPHIKREKCSPDQSPRRRSPLSGLKRSISPRIKREKRSPDKYKVKQHSPTPSQSKRADFRHFSNSPPPTHKPKISKTLDGKKAGLQDAKSLRIETEERRQREDRIYAEMSKDVSGRDAEVQVRSTGRRGKRARDAADEDPEERRQREERERKKKEQYDRWGKGLKQVEDHRERLEAEAYESNKPMARYANDEDLDKYLREKERAEDPMLEYMRKKRKEKQKESNVPEKPKYEGAYPENRFGILPGHKWDGVDRSNGFEKKWFDKQSERRAIQEEAYKYSVEDM